MSLGMEDNTVVWVNLEILKIGRDWKVLTGSPEERLYTHTPVHTWG
jgi:hypothetical protein